jgi:hypothetical protein
MINDQIDQKNFMRPFCALGFLWRNIEVLVHMFFLERVVQFKDASAHL